MSNLFPEGWVPVDPAMPHHRKVISDRVEVHVTTRQTGWSQFGVDAPDWHYCVVIDGQRAGQAMVDTRFEDVAEPHIEATRRAEKLGAEAVRYLADAEA